MNTKLRTLRTHMLDLVLVAVALGLTYQAEALPEIV